MAVIIGSITTVIIDGYSDGFQSVNWNINRQPTRLWELGSWDPYRTQVAATITVSVTTYAGVLDEVTLNLPTSCVDSTATKDIIINAEACDATVSDINEVGMFITSYSYSKGDGTSFATESWSFQQWIDSGITPNQYFITYPTPTYVLLGRTEGSRNGTGFDSQINDIGVRFVGEAGGSLPKSAHVVEGEQGSVSAGFPGLGNADVVEQGLIDRIGGGVLEKGGAIGQSSANVPHQPIYV